MRHALRQLGASILFATTSLALIFGGLSTSLAEKRINEPAPTITETSVPTRVADVLVSSTPTLSAPGLLPSFTPVSSPSPTATIPASTLCPAPNGWVAYIVQVGDTLTGLANFYGIPAATLQEKNCLISPSLIPDTRIYLPSVPPTATVHIIPCGAPYGWVTYTVKAGDNLYRISLAYRVTVAQLQQANCLGASINISIGQRLYVPNVVTSTPAVTATPSSTSTSIPTFTFTALPPSATLTNTPMPPVATFTFTPVPSNTPLPPKSIETSAAPTNTPIP